VVTAVLALEMNCSGQCGPLQTWRLHLPLLVLHTFIAKLMGTLDLYEVHCLSLRFALAAVGSFVHSLTSFL
jgi:hypothetical protein